MIPDDLIIETFFKEEQEEIEKIELKLSEEENLLTEAIEVVEYEANEEENVTTKVIKDYLSAQIEDMKIATKESAIKERETLKNQLNEIKKRETNVKKLKKDLKEKQAKLEHKIEVKREGQEALKTKYEELIKQADSDIKKYEAQKEIDAKEEKKRKTKIKNLEKDIETLKYKLKVLDELVESIGGQITEKKSQELILIKHFNMINNELNRYLNQEKCGLIDVFENLWDKYAASVKELEAHREKTTKELDEYLKGLKYYG